ncbi:hypothetical protein EGW08_013394 [Elysia chlorotica]|uniref:Thioredoxin domain-containing protein n=1 Tax=Elysia chlorotica TaxID=188477 RepID=A0A433TB84_ELYCH|nr:hypothetical protein EGW08_013394 [Elysia chlorotica]
MSRGKEPEKKRKSGKGRHDPFVGSKSVEGLDPKNYDDFLTEKDITMVMYYDANEPQCEWSKKHFLKAAKTTHRENHGYAAVDCVREADLCAQEGIVSLPTFKLFIGTQLVDTYTKPQQMTYITIKNFMETMKIVPEVPPCVRPCDKEKNVCYSKK